MSPVRRGRPPVGPPCRPRPGGHQWRPRPRRPPRAADPLVDLGRGQAVVVLVIAALAGLNVRTRRRYEAALVDRSERLMREREYVASSRPPRAQRDRPGDARHRRSWIGGDDFLGPWFGGNHPADPARAVQAMRQVAETGRVAVTDMRRMLGVLNEGDTGELAGAARHPGGGRCSALVELFRATGLPVVLQSAGVAPADPGIQLAVYRVVQEGLTNALKYARAATLSRFARSSRPGDHGLGDRRRPARGRPCGPCWHGIPGMRQRVALYGGRSRRVP